MLTMKHFSLSIFEVNDETFFSFYFLSSLGCAGSVAPVASVCASGCAADTVVGGVVRTRRQRKCA
jgi:hypothetical protein